MNIDFIKMQGTGNDFIMIDDLELTCNDYSEIASIVCDRHFGIGGDGLIVNIPLKDKTVDYEMKIFNSDGSEAEMCGNGIRCFTHYLRTFKGIAKNNFNIKTLAGIIKSEIIDYKPKRSLVKVDMGSPSFLSKDIPITVEKETTVVEDYTISINDQQFSINCVSMGNPHCVIFVKNTSKYLAKKWGPAIEKHHLFPENTNVEFIEIMNDSKIKMEVWERGSGRTLACGTGACASAVMGIKKDFLNKKVKVELPGGNLDIEWTGENVMMSGPAETVFKGSLSLDGVVES